MFLQPESGRPHPQLRVHRGRGSPRAPGPGCTRSGVTLHRLQMPPWVAPGARALGLFSGVASPPLIELLFSLSFLPRAPWENRAPPGSLCGSRLGPETWFLNPGIPSGESPKCSNTWPRGAGRWQVRRWEARSALEGSRESAKPTSCPCAAHPRLGPSTRPAPPAPGVCVNSAGRSRRFGTTTPAFIK